MTGFSYRTGNAFDVGRHSDYDIAIVSPRLLERVQASGYGLPRSDARSRAITWNKLPDPAMASWLRSLGLQYGRDASVMIYRSRRDLELRGPFLPID